jgi:hypothetical protein
MQIQNIKSQFDNVMVPLEINEGVMKNVIHCIEDPITCPNKDNIPQWKFCTVKNNIRCNDSMDKTNILILDFDDKGYSYEEFEDRFRRYKYFLHTSYSYDGFNSKFRVLLFLDKEYDIERMFCRNTEALYSPYSLLLTYFNHVDKASFVKSQFFKVPAIKDKTSPYYYNIHDGELFDMNNIPQYMFAYLNCLEHREHDRRDRETKARVFRTQSGDLTKALDFVKRKMEETPAGERHNAVFGLGAWYKHCGGDYLTYSRIKPTWADKKFDKQMQRLEREWNKL